jgi:hypothetical protein
MSLSQMPHVYPTWCEVVAARKLNPNLKHHTGSSNRCFNKSVGDEPTPLCVNRASTASCPDLSRVLSPHYISYNVYSNCSSHDPTCASRGVHHL